MRASQLRASLFCALGSVVGDRASLSCAVGRLCLARCAPIVRAVTRAGLHTPNFIVGDRTFCRGQSCPGLSRQKIPCHDRISPTAHATMSCEPRGCRTPLAFSLSWPALPRPKILYHDLKSFVAIEILPILANFVAT